MDDLRLRRWTACACRRMHLAALLELFHGLHLNRRCRRDDRRRAGRMLNHWPPRARRRARWPLWLLLLLLLLSATLRGARRLAAEMPVFALAKRLRHSRRGGRLDRH